MRWTTTACLGVVGLAFVSAAAQAGFIPWEPLVSDAWIVSSGGATLTMHTVNAGDYAVGFDVANGNKSRGMNALRFSYGGSSDGNLVSPSPAGSFAVENLGNARTFRDLVFLVAVEAAALPADFALSLGVAGQSAYTFNPAEDFGYYDHPTWATGRPSGYYSKTLPTGEGIACDFSAGMVTVYAAKDVYLGPSGEATFDYAFAHLPGRAVFGVYGYDASDPNMPWIYHTNRAVKDFYQSSLKVSTFEVAPEPATLALVACGLAAVLGRNRRCIRGEP